MTRRVCAIICIVLLFAVDKAAAEDSRYVKLSTIREETNMVIVATNLTHATVTVILIEVNGENLRAPDGLPLTNMIGPLGSKALLDVYQKEEGKNWSCNFSSKSGFGDVRGRHADDYVYVLPYEAGTAHMVGQSYGGSTSHTGALHYAIDFNMTEGTPVRCAREGIVVVTEDTFSEGGTEPEFRGKANFVIVRHDDESLGGYFHLKKHGVAVKAGDYVATGQIVGYSGNTGWSSGPHLHFSVHNLMGVGSVGRSFPTIIDTVGGRLGVLEKGKTYTAR